MVFVLLLLCTVSLYIYSLVLVTAYIVSSLIGLTGLGTGASSCDTNEDLIPSSELLNI